MYRGAVRIFQSGEIPEIRQITEESWNLGISILLAYKLKDLGENFRDIPKNH